MRIQPREQKLLIGLILVAIGLIIIFLSFKAQSHRLVMGEKRYNLEIVRGSAERNQGLSGRKSLLQQSGMLFVFEAPGKHCFWMKDMYFPIDMIWLSADKAVVHIEQNVQPETFPERFCPEQDGLYVLEVNAGQANEAGVRVGDTVSF